jgi:hypothetical protein
MLSPTLDFTTQIAAEVTDDLIKAGIEVLAAPGESTHIDFVNSTNYEEQLEAAGKAYLDWYMLTQVRCRGWISGFSSQGHISLLHGSKLRSSAGYTGTRACSVGQSLAQLFTSMFVSAMHAVKPLLIVYVHKSCYSTASTT